MLNRKSRAILAKFTEGDLQAELAIRKRQRLNELDRERSRLAAELARMDGKAPRRKQEGPARRPSTSVSSEDEPIRRATRAQMARLRQRLVEELKRHPKGVAIGVLRKAVRATPLQIRLSLVRLREERKIRTIGNRRRTRYFAV